VGENERKRDVYDGKTSPRPFPPCVCRAQTSWWEEHYENKKSKRKREGETMAPPPLLSLFFFFFSGSVTRKQRWIKEEKVQVIMDGCEVPVTSPFLPPSLTNAHPLLVEMRNV
jgi:hypothetical protein